MFWRFLGLNPPNPRAHFFLKSVTSLMAEACAYIRLERDDGSLIIDPDPAELHTAFRQDRVRIVHFEGGEPDERTETQNEIRRIKPELTGLLALGLGPETHALKTLIPGARTGLTPGQLPEVVTHLIQQTLLAA